jgi:ribonuclease P protein subunit POP4
MKVTPEITSHEFIGTEAKVAKSAHLGYEALTGRVVDETRNTFTLLKEGKRKIVPKNSSIFHFKFHDGTVVEIDGKLLEGRPEDRLKKNVRRLW